MVNQDTLIITVSASIVYLLAGSLLYFNFRELKAKHLNRVSFGVLIQALLPLSFIPQSFLLNDSYEGFLTVLAVIGGTTTIIGLLVVTWNLKIHQKSSIPNRFILLVFLVGVACSQVVTGSPLKLNGGEWEIIRPLYVRILLFIPVFWLIYELTRVMIIGIKVQDSRWSYVAIGYPLGNIVGVIFLALREQLPFGTTFYQIPNAIGTAFFCLAILKQTNLLIIPNINVSRVTLAQRNSGITKLNFPDSDGSIEEALLTTAAITGITTIIQEISGKQKLPPSLGYADYSINIYAGKHIFIYTISNGTHPMLDAWMNQISEKWDNNKFDYEDSNISSDLINEFQDEIKTKIGIFVQN